MHNTTFGVEVCHRVDSEPVNQVCDSYHISHFHVADVPGHNEIDETQDANCHFKHFLLREARIKPDKTPFETGVIPDYPGL